ncbi:MAG: Rrf2 family transcriptional regulator [Herpetosiphon sp.]
MRISAKTVYGVRALIHLAMHAERGPVLSRQIAQQQDIPETYLNQLVLQLRRAGLISSVRGPHGGHMLAQPAKEITVLQILEALEGPLVVVAENNAEDHVQTDEVLGAVWDQLREVMLKELARTSLGDLSEQLVAGRDQIMYEI